MPGPRNQKKAKKAQTQKDRKKAAVCAQIKNVTNSTPTDEATMNKPPGENPPPLSPTIANIPSEPIPRSDPSTPSQLPEAITHPSILHPLPPCLEATSTGPRVRDPIGFLESGIAHPPSLEDPLCAELAQAEVFDMLRSLLPEDVALIVWYNRTRRLGRICPACRRPYTLGDTLPDLFDPGMDGLKKHSPELYAEQALSGLCSPVCFVLACYNHPDLTRDVWGRDASALPDGAIAALAAPGRGADDHSFGLLLRMTRCEDLGLGELLFPGEVFDETDDETTQEHEWAQERDSDDRRREDMDEKENDWEDVEDERGRNRGRSRAIPRRWKGGSHTVQVQ